MKKFVRILVKLALVAVLLGAIGLVALRLMFPPEKIKKMTLDYAHNTLHRELSFDSVSFNLIGITLTNVALSENSSFEQGTFIKADKVQAKAALWPLLKKRVEISTLRVDGLDVNLIKNKDNSFNFDTLLSSNPAEETTAATSAKSSAGLSFAITAKHVRATDCDFYYQDLQTGFKTSVEDLNIQLNDFDTNAPFPAKISFTSQTRDGNELSVSVPANVSLEVFLAGLNLPQAYVKIFQASATYKKVALALQGEVKDFENPSVAISGSITGVDHTAFADFLPDLPAFKLPQINVSLRAQADLQKEEARIQQADFQVLNNTLSVNGRAGWATGKNSYRLTANLKTDLTQIIQMADRTDFNPGGIITASLTATEKNDGKDVSGTVTLKNLSALYPPFILTQTNGTIKITSLDAISSDGLNGLINGENFNLSFVYKKIKEVLDIVLRLHVDKLTLTELPSFGTSQTETKETTPDSATAPKRQSTDTEANITANITTGAISMPYFRTDGLTLQATLTRVSESMKNTNGTVSFDLQPGAITDIDKLLKQNKIVRIVLLPLGLLNNVGKKLKLNLFEAETQAQKGEIAMTKAQGKYTFTQGVMNLDSTTFESALTNINATGTVNFVTNDLNMKASATLLTKQTPVVIKVTGTLDNPSGKVDMLNTVGSVVGGILSYKTAKSAVQSTAGVAGGAVKGTASTASNVTTTAAKDTAKAAKATVKAIGSLFKKSPSDSEETSN
ncbi:MAG: AsmA family protein [Elusimicrobiaceae bacterium]|nr:AsmA family protein [Elusimicrobiaceae bacterium]